MGIVWNTTTKFFGSWDERFTPLAHRMERENGRIP